MRLLLLTCSLQFFISWFTSTTTQNFFFPFSLYPPTSISTSFQPHTHFPSDMYSCTIFTLPEQLDRSFLVLLDPGQNRTRPSSMVIRSTTTQVLSLSRRRRTTAVKEGSPTSDIEEEDEKVTGKRERVSEKTKKKVKKN